MSEVLGLPGKVADVITYKWWWAGKEKSLFLLITVKKRWTLLAIVLQGEHRQMGSYYLGALWAARWWNHLMCGRQWKDAPVQGKSLVKALETVTRLHRGPRTFMDVFRDLQKREELEEMSLSLYSPAWRKWDRGAKKKKKKVWVFSWWKHSTVIRLDL